MALVVIHKCLREAVVLAGTDICSSATAPALLYYRPSMALCNICIPHIPVGYAGTQAQGGETLCYSNTCKAARLPSMALDTGIPAGMTTLKYTCV